MTARASDVEAARPAPWRGRLPRWTGDDAAGDHAGGSRQVTTSIGEGTDAVTDRPEGVRGADHVDYRKPESSPAESDRPGSRAALVAATRTVPWRRIFSHVARRSRTANEHPGGVEPTADCYRRLVERISDVVSIVDEEGIVRYQSPSSERVKGWPAAALVGENMLEYVHPADRDRVAELMRSIVDDPGARTDRVEYRFRTPDDDYVWLASTGSNPADGVIDGYVVTSRDVTERRRLEAALRRERDRLEAFATVISHDLLGPLNAVDGSIDLAEETGDPEHFERARGGVDRIEELAGDLLTLAKEGAVIGDREPVRLAAVAERAWEDLHTADATLTAESTVTVRADKARLRQLFENLFRNALERAGGDVADVDDTPDGDGFLVADDGPGVPEADRERVFEVGVSTASRETGMGLAIVRKVAEAHGWSVAPTESDRGGARFEVTGVDPVDDG